MVLLIFAGVSINLILGDNGIVKKAQEAREKTEEAKANEEKDFAGWTDSTDKILNDNQNDDDDDYDNGMAKYFTYTVNEDTREATITGIVDEYCIYEYYGSKKTGVIGINDNGNNITELFLPSRIIDNGNEYNVTKIGKNAFSKEKYNNGTIKKIVLPNSIKEVEERAFSGQDSVEEITFSNKLEIIGDYAFFRCHVQKFNLPKTLTTIGSYGLYSVAGTTAKIYKKVENIGKYAFDGFEANIYCEATEKPEGWNEEWCESDDTTKVYWNQTL